MLSRIPFVLQEGTVRKVGLKEPTEIQWIGWECTYFHWLSKPKTLQKKFLFGPKIPLYELNTGIVSSQERIQNLVKHLRWYGF